MKQPIVIPPELISDRATKNLVTAWLHAHARFRVCNKRLYWGTKAASTIEKKRRKEKWRVVARIREIERTLLKWLARSTHHPDIWMSAKPNKPESRLFTLEHAYYENRRRIHGLGGPARAKGMRERESLVRQIRTIEWTWIATLVKAVEPNAKMPTPLPLHPRELLPRKIATASKELLKEVS